MVLPETVTVPEAPVTSKGAGNSPIFLEVEEVKFDAASHYDFDVYTFSS
jgi:hypothetical protein